MTNDQPEPKLDLLIKLLGMTTSASDGEALNAMRKANSFITTKLKTDWNSLLRGKVTIIEDPFNSIGMQVPSAPMARARPTPPAAPKPPPPPPPDRFPGMTALPGRTFEIKDRLRAMGGRWDDQNRVWMIPNSWIDDARIELRAHEADLDRQIHAAARRASTPRPAPRRAKMNVTMDDLEALLNGGKTP